MERDTYNLLSSSLHDPALAIDYSAVLNHRVAIPLAAFPLHLDFPRRENRGSNW